MTGKETSYGHLAACRYFHFYLTLGSFKVIRSDSSEPVALVNIIMTELVKGTVSNLDREFNFRLPTNVQDTMEVVFSHIGLESTTFQAGDLYNSPIEVKLIPSEYEMDQEAIVLDFDPKVIMERAQDNLVETQYGSPHEIDVFFKESSFGEMIPSKACLGQETFCIRRAIKKVILRKKLHIEQLFDMRPYAIEQRLKLRNPIYEETPAYGHMGRQNEVVTKTFLSPYRDEIVLEVELFTWQKLDYVDRIKSVFGL